MPANKYQRNDSIGTPFCNPNRSTDSSNIPQRMTPLDNRLVVNVSMRGIRLSSPKTKDQSQSYNK